MPGGPTALGGTNGDLRFSDFTTFNLRLFADLGQQRALARKHPWLRGHAGQLGVDNSSTRRLQVRDQTGLTPISYQPAFSIRWAAPCTQHQEALLLGRMPETKERLPAIAELDEDAAQRRTAGSAPAE